MVIFDFLFKRSKQVHHDTASVDKNEDYSWLWTDYERTKQYFLNKEHQYKDDDPYQLHFTYNKLIKLYDRYTIN
ncbi:MAG TPA: hypothetical protein GX497_12855 [Bacillus bacterium]|nr:hypothetical protein [Bacillus sp. (in: firmicutes)]